MRLALLGGGGFRVPLVYGALARDRGPGAVEEVVLYDVAPERLARIEAVLQGLAAYEAHPPRVRSTTSLLDAVSGADFVFSAIRVGGLAERAADERAALELGLLGQETTGAGGVLYGLRSVPEAVRIAEAVAEHAPDAWTINFTNPAGMVTEAMAAVLGDRVIGICDSPLGLCRRVARLLGVPFERVWFDYAGLNHLGWLRAAYVDGIDRLPSLLASDAVEQFEEGRLFGAERLRALGAVPNEYLHYWYATTEVIASLRSSETRGAFLARQQAAFYAEPTQSPARAHAAWQRTRREREQTYMAEARDAGAARDEEDLAGGYEGVALALMRAIARDEQATLILNVRNRSAIAALDPDAVVEVPCLVGSNGAHPFAAEALDASMLTLVQSVKAVDRLTIQAALSGSRDLALDALSRHPLVADRVAAERLLPRGLSPPQPG